MLGENKIVRQLAYPLALCLTVLLILYPFSAFVYTPKWDSINGFLPYRYFISFYLENDQTPFWNPFQRLGYPGYADLQSGCWYPITRIIMLFGQYDVTGLIIELLSCFLIAALGMYRLSLYLHGCQKTAFLLGLCYSLSGFMIGSAHLMVFLIGVAWLPWIIWAVLSFFDLYQTKYAIYAAGFIAMNLTGASPAYNIILAYILVGMLLYHVIRRIYSFKSFWELIKAGWPAVVVLIVLIAPYVLSFLDFAPYFNRLGKRPYEEMTLNPLAYSNYISLIFPYAVNDVKSDWFKPTDLSLRNVYTGLVVFVAFLSAVVSYRHKTRFYLPLIFSTVFACWLSFGDLTFLYKWVYMLPGFGLFRHPSFFRSYAIFCVLLLAGFRFKDFFKFYQWHVADKISMFLIGSVMVVSTVCAGFISAEGSWQLLIEEIKSKTEIVSTGVWPLIWFNGMMIMILLFLVFLLKRTFAFSWFFAFAIFTAAEMTMMVRLTGPTTLYYTFGFDKMKSYFGSLPDTIVQPDLVKPLKDYDDKAGVKGTDGIWVNVSTFNKTISWQGENPLRFAGYENAWKNGTLDINLENPLFFFPQRELNRDTSHTRGFIWSAPRSFNFFNDQVSIRSIHVDFNRFSAYATNNSHQPQWLVLNQNYHHLWKASVNGKEMEVYPINDMLMGVMIPPGVAGHVIFEYDSPLIMPSWNLALIGWLVVLVVAIRDLFHIKRAHVH
jgi:hypothetical protein